MAAPQPPPRPAADGHTPGRRRRLPHIRRRGGRIARGLHHGLRPLRPGGVPREQHRLPAQADQHGRRAAGARQAAPPHGGRTCSLRSPRADDGRTERRQRIPGPRPRPHHPPAPRPHRLVLHPGREGHGLHPRGRAVPARPHARNAPDGAAGRGLLPCQPPVHRRAARRERDRRVVRQPADDRAGARGTRTDRGAESPRGRIQAVAQGVE